MTMSAISDEAVEVIAAHMYTSGSGIAWSQIDPNSSVALNYKRWATEALEAALPHLLKAAVHEAYVNAQRAVAALSLDGATVGYRHGRETMQEDAVRAIREAAEENRTDDQCPDNLGGTHFKITARGGDDESLGYMHCGFCGEVQS